MKIQSYGIILLSVLQVCLISSNVVGSEQLDRVIGFQRISRIKRRILPTTTLPADAQLVAIHNMRERNFYGAADGLYKENQKTKRVVKIENINERVTHAIIGDAGGTYTIFFTVKHDGHNIYYYLTDGAKRAIQITGLPDDAKLMCIHQNVVFFGSESGAYEVTHGQPFSSRVSFVHGKVIGITALGPGRYNVHFDVAKHSQPIQSVRYSPLPQISTESTKNIVNVNNVNMQQQSITPVNTSPKISTESVIKSTNSDVTELQNRIDKLEKENKLLKEQLENASKKIEDLKHKLKESEEKLKDLQAKYDKLLKENETLKKKLATTIEQKNNMEDLLTLNHSKQMTTILIENKKKLDEMQQKFELEITDKDLKIASLIKLREDARAEQKDFTQQSNIANEYSNKKLRKIVDDNKSIEKLKLKLRNA